PPRFAGAGHRRRTAPPGVTVPGTNRRARRRCMSRIDEALKRAGEGPDRWELRGGAPVRTDAALDRYAAEAARGHAGAAVRRPRAIGLEASSPESPTRVLPTAAASNPRLVASREAPALLIEQCRRLAASL